MNIVVHADTTGFAPKDCRFTAYDDDTYDWAPDQRRASSVGYGATREEAVADLLEIMEAEGEITVDEMTMLLAAHGAKRYLDPDRQREDQEDRLAGGRCRYGLED